MNDCSLKSTRKDVCPKPKIPKNATLRQLVDFYKRCCAATLKFKSDSFKKLSLEKAVNKAAWGKEVSGKHIGHLRCLPMAALGKGGTLLSSQKNQQALTACKTFDELYGQIKKLVDGKPGLGPMYVYDVALRLGGSLNKRPEKVYLQQGTLKGAKRLLGKAAWGKCVLEKTDFPSELHCLNAAEIEDFLCIFKDHLKGKNR